MSLAGGSNGFNIISGSGGDTLKGGGNADTFTIASSGEGNSDVFDGGGGTDTFKLLLGSHVFASDATFTNIETVLAHASGQV